MKKSIIIWAVAILLVIGIISIVMTFHPSTNIIPVSPTTNNDVANVSSIANMNLSKVKCDGSNNMITLDLGYLLSLIEISNITKGQLADLGNSSFVTKLYVLSLPASDGEQNLTQDYYSLNTPDMLNHTQNWPLLQQETAFLVISNATG